MVPISFRINAKVFGISSKALCDLVCLWPTLGLLSTTFPFSHHTPAILASCCSSKLPSTHPPQALCTCCSHCLNSSSLSYSHDLLPHFLQVSATMSLPQKGLPKHSQKVSPSLLCYPLTLLFLNSIYHYLLFITGSFYFASVFPISMAAS